MSAHRGWALALEARRSAGTVRLDETCPCAPCYSRLFQDCGRWLLRGEQVPIGKYFSDVYRMMKVGWLYRPCLYTSITARWECRGLQQTAFWRRRPVCNIGSGEHRRYDRAWLASLTSGMFEIKITGILRGMKSSFNLSSSTALSNRQVG